MHNIYIYIYICVCVCVCVCVNNILHIVSTATCFDALTSPLGFIESCSSTYDIKYCLYTGLFEMIVGILTTCRTQYTSDSSIRFVYLTEQHSQFLLHTLQVLYMCNLCDSTNINTIIEFVPTTQLIHQLMHLYKSYTLKH